MISKEIPTSKLRTRPALRGSYLRGPALTEASAQHASPLRNVDLNIDDRLLRIPDRQLRRRSDIVLHDLKNTAGIVNI